jgi:hypothetical protein
MAAVNSSVSVGTTVSAFAEKETSTTILKLLVLDAPCSG